MPYITTIAAACAVAKGIAAFKKGKSGVKSLQEYHADIGQNGVEGGTYSLSRFSLRLVFARILRIA